MKKTKLSKVQAALLAEVRAGAIILYDPLRHRCFVRETGPQQHLRNISQKTFDALYHANLIKRVTLPPEQRPIAHSVQTFGATAPAQAAGSERE